ncbi:MAG: hypothetical protein Terrestrivirus10_36 [Terrestrivirus sp.]|uniref:Uncharacterized protein n=1 Tax=Terrestrivirus sp. TaxID=2487775 RepID=A0A3G4ZP29_9VIRU|nr:MAG: hypothetical protein Terrestrivirus10_36 [Terrestrivirus sp.]
MTGVIKIFLYKNKKKKIYPHDFHKNDFNKNDLIEIELDDMNIKYNNYDPSDPYNPLNLKNEFMLSGHCNDGLNANSICGHDDDIEFSQDDDIHKLIFHDSYSNNVNENNTSYYQNKNTNNKINIIKKYITSTFKKLKN